MDNILANASVSKYAKGYVRGKSLKDNARFHRKQKVVMSLDVKDFFGSINAKNVYSVFRKMGYKEKLSWELAYLCTKDGSLPQGAPTSSALSNLVMIEFDETVGKYTNDHRIRYTRYADDMTFSGDFDEIELIRFVRQELGKIGLKLNHEKTRTRTQGQKQEVTGIVVNEKMQTSKQYRKDIRQEMYYIQKFGLESHLEHTGNKKQHYLEHLEGKVNYVLFVNPRDEEFKRYKQIVKELQKGF